MMKVIVKSNTDKSILLGSAFKVFKDKSIEVPCTFRDEEFDEFLK